MIVGLLHTVPALAGSMDARLGELLPEAERIHLADAWLLDEAIRSGVDERHDARVKAHVDHLVAQGASAVLVSCSSIGEVTDRVAETVDVPVLRVDRPMARRAGELARAAGGRVAVLATLASTLGPTGRLLEAEADGCAIDSSVVEGAIEAKQTGDQAGFDRLVTAAVDAALASHDVVVLAQASMASALTDDRAGRVLTSPESALAQLVEAVRR